MLDGGELQVEVGEDLRVNLTGWAQTGVRGPAERGVRRGAAQKGASMRPSKRLERIPPYAFAQLEAKIAREAQGRAWM